MKRIFLLIAFFVGLIPNLKEMCFECAYCVMGQSMYDENFWDEVPEGSCEDFGGIWCDICSTCHAETNTNPSCLTECEQCGISYPTGSTHYHNDNGNDNNDDNDNNDEGNDEGNNEGNSGTNHGASIPLPSEVMMRVIMKGIAVPILKTTITKFSV